MSTYGKEPRGSKPICFILTDPAGFRVIEIDFPLTGDQTDNEELIYMMLECEVANVIELPDRHGHFVAVDANSSAEKVHGWLWGDRPFYGEGLFITLLADGEWQPPQLTTAEMLKAIRFFWPFVN